MVYFWQQIPFFRFLLAFVAGILFRIFTSVSFFTTSTLVTIFFLGVLLLTVLYKYLGAVYKYNWISGMGLNVTLFFAGMALVQLKTPNSQVNNIALLKDTTTYYTVRLLQPVVEKAATVKVLAEVRYYKHKQRWMEVTGKVLLYLPKDSSTLSLISGNKLVIRTRFNPIKPPQNPHEFDYKTYLLYQGITKQAYLKPANWRLLAEKDINPIVECAYQLRSQLLTLYTACGFKGQEYGVLAALVLGYNDKLDPGLLTAYSQTGVVHVLSVSGMHVGIIYLMLNFTLLFLNKIKHGARIKAILLLAFLWFYALLTGLSPAVMRAVCMFSFVVIAAGFNLNTNIFNTLAVSCFLLLLYNPYLVMDVGFQLSYCAVLGIVLLQANVSEIWMPDHTILQFIWQLMVVSIVAQVFTFPLALYYFHQFPNLFLLANIIVIPLSTLVLYAGISLFFVAKIPWLGVAVSYLLKLTLQLMNLMVKWLQQLPFLNLNGVSINSMELLLVYLLIIVVLLFITTKAYRYFIGTLTVIIILLTMQVSANYKEQLQRRIIVYNIPKHAAYDLITGKANVFFADSLLHHADNLLSFYVRPNWYHCGINKHQQLIAGTDSLVYTADFYMKNNLILFHSKRIVIVGRNFKIRTVQNNKKLKVDYLILSQNTPINLAQLLSFFEFKELIIDSSNTYSQMQRWRRECAQYHFQPYCVMEKGAFIAEL